MNQIPDAELIKKSIDGDGQAFATLIKRVETRLLRLVRAEIADLTYAVARGAVGCVARLEAAAGLGTLGRMGTPDCPAPVHLRFLWVGTSSGGTDGAQRP